MLTLFIIESLMPIKCLALFHSRNVCGRREESGEKGREEDRLQGGGREERKKERGENEMDWLLSKLPVPGTML